MQEVELEILETSYKRVKELSIKVANKVEVAYDDFFADMYNSVIEDIEDYAPTILRRYLPHGSWDDITKRWHKTKVRHGVIAENSGDYNHFYRGISHKALARKALSRSSKDGGVSRAGDSKRRPTKPVQVGPFAKYIQSLQSEGNVERFFGPVMLGYSFVSPQMGEKITAKMGPKNLTMNNFEDINKIRHIYITNAKGQHTTSLPSRLQVTATIQAFPVLESVKKDEWYLVDYILKRIDPANEKQWVKINGRMGGRTRGARPIRPIIAPLVQYFINQKLARAMEKVISGV
jgi:hypothetical protein